MSEPMPETPRVPGTPAARSSPRAEPYTAAKRDAIAMFPCLGTACLDLWHLLPPGPAGDVRLPAGFPAPPVTAVGLAFRDVRRSRKCRIWLGCAVLTVADCRRAAAGCGERLSRRHAFTLFSPLTGRRTRAWPIFPGATMAALRLY